MSAGETGSFDLVVRGGTVVDGTGAASRRADVGIRDGVVVAVGAISSAGSRELDADGMLVTPGFVDIHTHFDGQATWDPELRPSSQHGVTTVAFGNCGVGFAPARPDRHDWLISLLEGVEDIPGTALSEGMTWGWESFPEYLDVLAGMGRTVDVATHIPHAALRTYVMGDRGADHLEHPDETEVATMARLVGEALDAGAIGFATSRTEIHRTSAGANIGTLRAGEAELLAIADAMRTAGSGVIQLISDCYLSNDEEFAGAEIDLIGALARTSGRPLSFTVQQPTEAPERWRRLFGAIDGWRAGGLDVKGQVAPRPIGVLLGLQATTNPFVICPAYAEIAAVPLAERTALLTDPARKERILAEHDSLRARFASGLLSQILFAFDSMFEMGDPVDYELDPRASVDAHAARAGVDAASFCYDLLLQRDGTQLLYLPMFNFAHRDFADIHAMITQPGALFGLSDAGAHCGAICDASSTTSFLTVWARDCDESRRLPVEAVVHQMTQRTARHVGWHDRGVLAPGYLADLNVIDFAALDCAPPRIIHDLPAGGRRLVQDARGYRATVKSGVVTMSDGAPTGERPGRLIRGATSGPG